MGNVLWPWVGFLADQMQWFEPNLCNNTFDIFFLKYIFRGDRDDLLRQFRLPLPNARSNDIPLAPAPLTPPPRRTARTRFTGSRGPRPRRRSYAELTLRAASGTLRATGIVSVATLGVTGRVGDAAFGGGGVAFGLLLCACERPPVFFQGVSLIRAFFKKIHFVLIRAYSWFEKSFRIWFKTADYGRV